MDNESRSFINSPVIRNNTPIRRMGLSRKRKSCCAQNFLSPKIQAFGEKGLETPTHLDKTPLDNLVLCCNTDNEDGNNPVINYDNEIELLKQRISEAEEKLETLQSNSSNIKQLEELIDVWKNGCRSAYLQFSQILQERQPENVDLKGVLNKLGILETILDNFENDPEISFSD